MLKSLSTQIAATLFFGPIGLAYTSMAAAVFMTLVLAVLFFSELGILSLFVVWPLSMLVGMVFVKLHNDQVRSSGSRLLLGPGDDFEPMSAAGSWTRALAVLSLILVGGFALFLYMPKGGSDIGSSIGRIVSPSPASAESNTDLNTALVTDTVVAPSAQDVDSTPAVIAANANQDNGDDNFAVIALPEREVATVVIDPEGNVAQGEVDSALNSGRPQLTVDATLVNLRRGPGTGFDIVTQLQSGEQLFEFARDGNWINVEIADSGETGWIYSQLVRQQ